MDERSITNISDCYTGGPYNVYFSKLPLRMGEPSLTFMYEDTRKDALPNEIDAPEVENVVGVLYSVTSDVVEFAKEFVYNKKWYQVTEFVEELNHVDKQISSQLEELLLE